MFVAQILNTRGWLQVAERFVYQAFEADELPSVLWVIQLDPRGATSVVHRCKQARPDPPCVYLLA